MFNALFESSGFQSTAIVGANAARNRRLATASSVTLQIAFVSTLAILPLLHFDPPPPLSLHLPSAVPEYHSMPLIVVERERPGLASNRLSTPAPVASRALQVPRQVPHGIVTADPGSALPTNNYNCTSCPVAADPTLLNSVIGTAGTGLPVVATPPQRVRVSSMDAGALIERVQPDYPATAKLAGVQGVVVLRAVIARNGAISALHVVSGHPMLVNAAVSAVKQWRYRPYVLNGEPVEVETEITVNFSLGR